MGKAGTPHVTSVAGLGTEHSSGLLGAITGQFKATHRWIRLRSAVTSEGGQIIASRKRHRPVLCVQACVALGAGVCEVASHHSGSNGGGGHNEGEPSKSVGAPFGRLTLLHTATHQEPLDCNHSKAHNSKSGLGTDNDAIWCVKNALSARQPAACQLFGLLSACTQHGIKRVLRATKLQQGAGGGIGLTGTRVPCF